MELKKFNNVLKLSVLFSFFLFNISWFFSLMLTNLRNLFTDTFLSNVNSILYVLENILFGFLQYALFIFFILCLVTLFIVFLIDVLNNRDVKSF